MVDAVGAQHLPPARALQGDEHRVGRGVLRPLVDQVLTQLGEEGVGDGHHPLVAALALGDEQRALADLDVGQAQSEDLAAAQAAEDHGKDHGPVPVGAQRTDQGVDVAGERIFGRVRGTRTSGTVRTRPPRRRVESPFGTGFVSTGVSPRATRYDIEARHRRQPAGDGPGRQS